MRFPPNRPFFDRGRGRGMRRPFRGFANRNFRFNPRYRGQHSYRGGYKDREYQTSPVERSRRTSFSPSPSRSRLHSPSPPLRRRSATPELKRRPSRSLTPSIASTGSVELSKSPAYKSKDLKGSEISHQKGPESRGRYGKAGHSLSKSGRSKSPDSPDGWRGRSVSGETKPSFSKEDLEKITVDVQCSLVQESSPIVRQIINADEVKIVRRVGEGHKPLFDRAEIQNPSVDFRDESVERVISVKGGSVSENQGDETFRSSGTSKHDYTRTESTSRVPVKKHWEQDDRSSASSSSYTKTRKKFSEERDLSPVYDVRRSVSPPRGSYLKGSSGTDRELHRKNSAERSYNRHNSGDLGDLRPSLSSRYKEDDYDRHGHKFLDSSDLHHRPSTTSRKHYNGELEHSRSRSRSPLATYESQLQGRSEGRVREFSPRPDRFKYSSWTDKPERDVRDHGGTRPFRSRGFRSSRFFRPRTRGYVPRSNGAYTGRRPFRSTTGYTPRSRGFVSR